MDTSMISGPVIQDLNFVNREETVVALDQRSPEGSPAPSVEKPEEQRNSVIFKVEGE